VWLPLTPGWPGGRVALCALDTAIPDPWHQYRARQELARQQAARAESQALTNEDPGDGIDDLAANNPQP
jgi:hypothetical protein